MKYKKLFLESKYDHSLKNIEKDVDLIRKIMSNGYDVMVSLLDIAVFEYITLPLGYISYDDGKLSKNRYLILSVPYFDETYGNCICSKKDIKHMRVVYRKNEI